MKKYFILVGNFGSGKSEIAINLALQSAARGEQTTLVDLDIVNPYFRSGERGDVLEAAGVRLIAPPFALHKIEIISLSPAVYSIFTEGGGIAIIDAGGDPIGATALGQYRTNFDNIPPENVHALMVINPFRPLADSTEKAVRLMEGIEGTSRHKITGFINNANLAGETGAEELYEGYRAVRELSKFKGVPVYATSGTKPALAAFGALACERALEREFIGRYIELDIAMHRSWDKYINEGL